MARNVPAPPANARSDACAQHVDLQLGRRVEPHFQPAQNSRKRHMTNAAKRRGKAPTRHLVGPTTAPSGKGDDEKNNSFQSRSRLQQTPERPTDLDNKAVVVMRP